METVTKKNGGSPHPVKQLPMFATLALLDKFKPQDKVGSELQLKSNAQAEIANAFAKTLEFPEHYFLWNKESTSESWAYDKCLKVAKTLKYTAADIEAFSKCLPAFQHLENFEWASGDFLSALINAKNFKKVSVHTAGLSVDIRVFPSHTKCDITVFGNLGMCVGPGIYGGTLTVNGHVGAIATKLIAGKIVVNGNIFGTIRVHGMGPFYGKCEIYQREQLLVKNGEVLHDPEYQYL